MLATDECLPAVAQTDRVRLLRGRLQLHRLFYSALASPHCRR